MYQSDENFKDKRFAFETTSGLYFFYVPTMSKANKFEYTCHKLVQSKDFQLGDVLVLSDISELKEPANHAKWTLIFSSPNPHRYKNFLKSARSYKFIVPTWSEEELWLVNRRIEEWYDRFLKCGGIIRLVLWDGEGIEPLSILDAALSENGAMVANNFFVNGFDGYVDYNINYSLIHINPPFDNNDEVGFLYDCSMPVFTFASDYVFRQIVRKHTIVQKQQIGSVKKVN
jgi:hypothetical protein